MGSRLDHLAHEHRILMTGKNKDPQIRQRFDEPAQDFHPVKTREFRIQDSDIRLGIIAKLDRLVTLAGLPTSW